MVTEPTRVTETTASILDLFFTSNQTLINKVEVIAGISDHEAVFIESSLRPMRVKTPPRKVFQYKKADYEGMKQELKAFQIEFEELAETEDVEQLWTRFKKKMHSLMESHIPAKTIKSISHGFPNRLNLSPANVRNSLQNRGRQGKQRMYECTKRPRQDSRKLNDSRTGSS